jgi:hypothetical protein
VKTLDDKDLINALELAAQIGCNESFLYMLVKELEHRKLRDTRSRFQSKVIFNVDRNHS